MLPVLMGGQTEWQRALRRVALMLPLEEIVAGQVRGGLREARKSRPIGRPARSIGVGMTMENKHWVRIGFRGIFRADLRCYVFCTSDFAPHVPT